MIVTSSDLGLALTCQYDLTNKTVSNDVDLGVTGDIEPSLSEEVVVDSPNVIMKITTRDGSAMKESAEVGDPLALKFEIMDEQSPYEIFVRELVAMDGADSGEITLIDARGCPTDHYIMGPIYKSNNSGKILLSHFDAFKFPSSQTVQFRALVTPCMPTCEPVQCDDEEFGGELRSIISYGRKRRSVSVNATLERRLRRSTEDSKNPHDDMLLVQSIQITDKFGFPSKQQQSKPSVSSSETVFYAKPDAQNICVNGLGKWTMREIKKLELIDNSTSCNDVFWQNTLFPLCLVPWQVLSWLEQSSSSLSSQSSSSGRSCINGDRSNVTLRTPPLHRRFHRAVEPSRCVSSTTQDILVAISKLFLLIFK